ncbi:MAG: protein kinase, partial [Bacteroidota bacterium]
RWTQIEDLYHDALDLPPEEREALVRHIAQDDTALLDAVLRLLSHHQEPIQWLEHGLGHTNAEHSPSAAGQDSLIGTRIGPYRIDQLIGHGGMGVVYRARRDEGGFEQQVAIKLLHPTRATDSLRARFHAEQQILAGLNHPHIARLYDGGFTSDGLPFFVMEYVEGQPITAYCDEQRLSIEERLRLFQIVCEAVHYAHRNLVVHRDLKPSNILVTTEGQVKLLDFGIAKLLRPNGGETVMPVTAQPLLTPEYASPEQVRGEAITTGSDVYSLGVLLYEMLTGHRPYRLTSRMQRELERVICEEMPLRPSARVIEAATRVTEAGTTETLAPDTLGQARQVSPDRLQRSLRGGLDDVILMALRKEADRRYSSAEQFRADIARYLHDEPVVARGESVGYRAALFVRRHRWGVVATALVLISLVGGLGVSLWQTQRAEGERAAAEQVAAFMEAVFAGGNPLDATFSDTLRVVDVLAQAEQKADTALAAQPRIQAQVLRTIGRAYASLGRYASSEVLSERAYTLYKETVGEADPRTLNTLSEWGIALLNVQNYEGALEAVSGVIERAPASERLVLAQAHQYAAVIHHRLSRFDDGIGHGERALAILTNSRSFDALDIQADAHNVLALMHSERDGDGDLGKAAIYAAEAAEAWRRLMGENHLQTAEALNTLGILQSRLQRFEDAMASHQRALKIRRRVLPSDHPHIAASLLNMGVVRHRKARYDDAIALHEQAAEAFRIALGPQDGYYYGYTLYSLAVILKDTGEYASARSLLDDAHRIQRDDLCPDHADVLETGRAIAEVDSLMANLPAER